MLIAELNYRLGIFVVLLWNPTVFCQDQCTPRNYPAFFDISLTVAEILLIFYTPPAQYLVTNYQFGCNGMITKWELYCLRNGAQTIEFHVWHRNTSIDGVTAYNLVGMNVVPDAKPDGNNLLSYSVPRDQQIQVQPGDIVGIRGYNATESENFRFQVHLTLDLTKVIGYSLREDEATPEFLNLAEHDGGPRLGSLNIRVTVTETTSSTPLIPDQPMTTPTPFVNSPETTTAANSERSTETTFPNITAGNSIVTGVAITVAVSLTFMVVFTISLICGYCILKAMRHQQQYSGNIYSQPNQSYNIRAITQMPPGRLTGNNHNQFPPRGNVEEEADHTYEEIDSQHGGDTYDYADSTTETGEVQMSSTLDEDGYINI